MIGQDIVEFRVTQDKLRHNGFFLTVNENGILVVGEKRYQNTWNAIKNEDKVGFFGSLEEVKAFCIGYLVSKNRCWKA